MDPYDSDSSLEDAKGYTETNVNLGYASNEPTEDTSSHLGGFPVRRAAQSSSHGEPLTSSLLDMARSFNNSSSLFCEV